MIEAECTKNERRGDTPARRAFERIASRASDLGFEYCCQGLRIPLPITRPRTVFLSNYDPDWERRYHERRYLEIDPTVRHGMRSSTPITWSEEFFAGVPEFWREAQSFGLRHGWAQSRRDPEGTYSLLVLARSEAPIEQAELDEKEESLRQLVHDSHAAIKASCTDPAIVESPPVLSEREIEVMRWSAEGKTAAEIAQLLRISERTVGFHVSCVVERLGATNKTNAVARASMLGLLW